MAQLTSNPPQKTSHRKQVIILLAISVFLLLAILVSQTAFDLTFLRPGNNQDIVVFAALSALIFLLFVALTFVLLRNLLKLLQNGVSEYWARSSVPVWWPAHFYYRHCRSW